MISQINQANSHHAADLYRQPRITQFIQIPQIPDKQRNPQQNCSNLGSARNNVSLTNIIKFHLLSLDKISFCKLTFLYIHFTGVLRFTDGISVTIRD